MFWQYYKDHIVECHENANKNWFAVETSLELFIYWESFKLNIKNIALQQSIVLYNYNILC